MYYFSTLRELSLSAGGRLRMSADTAAHFRSQVRECASTVSAPSLARADDGGVGVNARRSGVARRRPGPQSSKYSTLSSCSSAPCLFASMASILRCVCTTLGLCLLAVPLLQTRCAFHGLRRPLSQALDALLRADAAPVADRRLRLLLRAHIRHLVGCFRVA